jgi:hypothetical protein
MGSFLTKVPSCSKEDYQKLKLNFESKADKNFNIQDLISIVRQLLQCIKKANGIFCPQLHNSYLELLALSVAQLLHLPTKDERKSNIDFILSNSSILKDAQSMDDLLFHHECPDINERNRLLLLPYLLSDSVTLFFQKLSPKSYSDLPIQQLLQEILKEYIGNEVRTPKKEKKVSDFANLLLQLLKTKDKITLLNMLSSLDENYENVFNIATSIESADRYYAGIPPNTILSVEDRNNLCFDICRVPKSMTEILNCYLCRVNNIKSVNV